MDNKVGDKVYMKKVFHNNASYYESKIEYITSRGFCIIDGMPFRSDGTCFINYFDMNNAYYILTKEEYDKLKTENDIVNIKNGIIQYLKTFNISLKDLVKLVELLEIKTK